MPVIARRNHDRVNVWIVQHFPQIGMSLRRIFTAKLFTECFIGISKRNKPAAFGLRKYFGKLAATPASPKDRDAHLLVSRYPGRFTQSGRGKPRRRSTQKKRATAD